MSSVRAIAALLAVLLHGSTFFATNYKWTTRLDAFEGFEKGTGNDQIVVEQGIAIEGVAKHGDAMETVETPEVKPVEQATATPVDQEVKPDELRDAITAKDSKFDDNIVKAEEPPPVVAPPPPKPEVVEAKEQPAQVAMLTEQSSSEVKTGSVDTTQFNQYLGKLSEVVQKAAINPRSRLTGTVWVKFKVSPSGELLSREIKTSSGSKVLDEAAMAAIDRAAPFPPIPREASNEPITISVPFKFVTR